MDRLKLLAIIFLGCGVVSAGAQAQTVISAWANAPVAISLGSQRVAANSSGQLLYAAPNALGTLPLLAAANGSSLVASSVRQRETIDIDFGLQANALAAASDGGGFAVQSRPSADSRLAMTAVRFGSSGEILWSRELGGRSMAGAQISVSHNGAVVAVMLLSPAEVFVLDSSNGQIYWARRFDRALDPDAVLPRGNVLPKLAAMDDASVWLQPPAVGLTQRIQGNHRRTLPKLPLGKPDFAPCGIARIGATVWDVVAEDGRLSAAKRDLTGALQAVVTQPIPKVLAGPAPCALYRAGDDLYVATVGRLLRLNTATSQFQWSVELTGTAIHDVAAVGTGVFAVGVRSSNAAAFRLDTSSGAAAELQAPFGEGSPALLQAVVVNGEVVVNSGAALRRYSSLGDLNPQPITQIIAQRSALMGAAMSASGNALYTAVLDWQDGRQRVIVRRINPVTNAQLWQHSADLGPQHFAQLALLDRPAIVLGANRVVVTTSAIASNSVQPYAVAVHTFDGGSGALLGSSEFGPDAVSPTGWWLNDVLVDTQQRPYLRLSREIGSSRLLALDSSAAVVRWERFGNFVLRAVDTARLYVITDQLEALDLQTGASLWQRAIGAQQIISDTSFGLFVASVERPVSGQQTLRLDLLDSANGTSVWTSRPNLGPATASKTATRLAVSPDGALYVTGLIGSNSVRRIFLVKSTASTGAGLWVQEHSALPLQNGSGLFGHVPTQLLFLDGAEVAVQERISEYALVEDSALATLKTQSDLVRYNAISGVQTRVQRLNTARQAPATEGVFASRVLSNETPTWWVSEGWRARDGARSGRVRSLPIPAFSGAAALNVVVTLPPPPLLENRTDAVTLTITNTSSEQVVNARLLATLPPWLALDSVEGITATATDALDAAIFIASNSTQTVTLRVRPTDMVRCNPSGEIAVEIVPDQASPFSASSVLSATAAVTAIPDWLFADDAESYRDPDC